MRIRLVGAADIAPILERLIGNELSEFSRL